VDASPDGSIGENHSELHVKAGSFGHHSIVVVEDASLSISVRSLPEGCQFKLSQFETSCENLERVHGGEPLGEPFFSTPILYNPPHARNTLAHNYARLAVAYLDLLKRRTGNAISTT
jgi:hypothetical protein